MRNTLIQYIDIARIPKSNNLHLIVVTGKDADLNAQAHVVEIPGWALELVMVTLLTVIDRPSLLHSKQTPVVLDTTDDSWIIYNIVDETKFFNPNMLIKQLSGTIDQIIQPSS